MSIGTITFKHHVHTLNGYPATHDTFRYDELIGGLEGFLFPVARTLCFKKATIGVGIWGELEVREQNLLKAILEDTRVIELEIARSSLKLRIKYRSKYEEVLESVSQAFKMQYRVTVKQQSLAHA